MNSATPSVSPAPVRRVSARSPLASRHAAPRRRLRSPARQPKSYQELSSFEKIVGPCIAPAFGIFEYLDETSIYRHDYGEQIIREYLTFLALAEMAVGLSVGSILWCVLKGIALVLRKVQRPKYYPQERLRRQALARERRRVRRRTTINAAPTSEDLLAQWAKVKGSPEEMIRFGSMLCDLEAYVDNSLLRNENGEIVGRNPGIRGWLNANCQPLAAHYKTVMGYKAMAEKFRQAVGLADPYPAALALGDSQNTVRKEDGQMAGDARKMTGDAHGKVEAEAENLCKNTVRKSGGAGPSCAKAKRMARKMLAECGRSQRGVRLALSARLSPDQVPPEVELEERRRQGLPRRDGLARRFVQMMA